MEIPENIVNGNEFAIPTVEQLKIDMQFCLDDINAGRDAILSKRAIPVFSPPNQENYFRNNARNENLIQILKYLITFLDQTPANVIYENKMLNPIEPFRECILFQVNLLLEKDVKKSVFNEINQMCPLDGDNVWDYQELIIEKNRELQELMAMATEGDASALFAICMALEQFCLFWFDVKQGDLRRIRHSDIFMYKLAKAMQDRYLKEKKKDQP